MVAVRDTWGLVLGASSGFGKQMTTTLAKSGYNIVGVHLDRRAAQEEITAHVESLKKEGVQAHYINGNADSEEVQQQVCEQMASEWGVKGKLSLLFHSLAFGSLKPFVGGEPKTQVSPRELQMTLSVMANSLLYWTQKCVGQSLFKENACIFSMTSAGSERIWKHYGPVSVAKAALECITRQLAVELAPYKIASNAIRAGVTITPALKKIPGSEEMVAHAQKVNPYQRLTQPEDVTNFVVSFMQNPSAYFVTGNVINVDGGELLR
jgi:enoyl-[acyl-carrier protein] reductase III